MADKPKPKNLRHATKEAINSKQIQGIKHRNTGKTKANPEKEKYQKNCREGMEIKNLPKLNPKEINDRGSDQHEGQKYSLATKQ